MSNSWKMSPKYLPRRVRNFYTMMAAAMVACSIMAPPCAARRIAAGDDFPIVSAKTLSGQQLERAVGSQKAALIAFLAADQKPSQQAAEELQRVLTSFSEHHQEIDIVIVMDDAALKDAFKDTAASPDEDIHFVHDTGRQLWGQFHIIAAPTVIIADKADKVTAVIPGYGYDFASSLRFHLNQALGIAQDMTAEELGKVKTAQNKSPSSRIQRHLQMAKMLQEKGKIKAAIQQLDQAQKMDPNDLQVLLQIGRLHCHQNQPDQAIKTLAGKEFTAIRDKAEAELIVGWANRLAGNSDQALAHLKKAIELNPASARAFFELGQVYEATKQNDLALKAYKQALSVLLDRK